jgi:hypothetical protein
MVFGFCFKYPPPPPPLSAERKKKKKKKWGKGKREGKKTEKKNYANIHASQFSMLVNKLHWGSTTQYLALREGVG